MIVIGGKAEEESMKGRLGLRNDTLSKRIVRGIKIDYIETIPFIQTPVTLAILASNEWRRFYQTCFWVSFCKNIFTESFFLFGFFLFLFCFCFCFVCLFFVLFFVFVFFVFVFFFFFVCVCEYHTTQFYFEVLKIIGRSHLLLAKLDPLGVMMDGPRPHALTSCQFQPTDF